VKYLLLLLLSGCFGPNFRVGDCVIEEPPANIEKWEHYYTENTDVFKILEIGKVHYHVLYLSPSYMKDKDTTVPFSRLDGRYVQMKCPQ
jgi:hypothetical protein